ncbi:hypothetical protein [Pacificoceanicola onchidii]|uniref:hypothetical protein n=1 Tax=Pacificoceanicola onchidii TaxID=2562685 RepID=UPI0010A2B6E3|nr:hypothetical protein [Pacificoceanicola onchidii]
MKRLGVFLIALQIVAQGAWADTTLSGKDIKRYLSGATVVFEDGDQKWLSNGKTVATFYSSSGRDVVNGSWTVERNRLCETFPNTGRACVKVVILTGGDVRFIPSNGNHYTGSKTN